MQIAGQACSNCGETIFLERDGVFCPACQSILCKDCAHNTSLHSCQTYLKSGRQENRPTATRTDSHLVSEKPAVKPAQTAPQDVIPKEPSVTHLGQRFTESEYVLARKHNTYRWIVSMGAGIPALLLLTIALGFARAMIVCAFLLPAVFEGATRFFPGSRKHGTALFKKYESRRKVEQHRFESRK